MTAHTADLGFILAGGWLGVAALVMWNLAPIDRWVQRRRGPR